VIQEVRFKNLALISQADMVSFSLVRVCVFSGMCSAGAPPAGDEPPAAAAGGAAGKSAGEERCRDPGLQREWSGAQQR